MSSRDIRFRVWLPKAQVFEYTELYACVWGDVCATSFSTTALPDKGAIIEQYTGLKDREDRAIYEGDIIRFDIGTGIDLDNRRTVTAEVKWDEKVARFIYDPLVSNRRYSPLDTFWRGSLVVVGNVHQHYADFFGIAYA